MGNFSSDPQEELRRSRERGYVGLRVEQGVPVLDRDLNLLSDLVTATVREVLERHLGSGVADRSEAFAVEAVPQANDLRVLAPSGGGTCLVGGVQVSVEEPFLYSEQLGVPALTTPAEDDRDDVVYLDVWVDEVDASSDPHLANPADVDMQTSVRLRPEWRVRVAEGTAVAPEPAPGHAHCPLAKIQRPRAQAVIAPGCVEDLRRTGLRLADLADRVQRLEEALLSSSLGIPGPAAGNGGAPPSGARVVAERSSAARNGSRLVAAEGGRTR